MIQNWFKIFYRNSKKSWLNIVVNLLGLTLGLAVLLIVLLFLKDEKSYNKNNTFKDSVYRVIHKAPDADVYWFWATDNEGNEYKENFPEIEDAYISGDRYKKTLIEYGDKHIYTENIVLGEPNFFDFFSFKEVKGSIAEFKKARNHIALSEERAKLFFGDKDPIGKTLKLYDRVFLVTTVYSVEGKHYYNPNAVIQFKEKPEGKWGMFYRTLFVKSHQNLNTPEFENKVKELWIDLEIPLSAERNEMTPEDYVEKYGVTKTEFEPIEDIRLKTKCSNAGPEGKGDYLIIRIVLFLTILLLIISSVNVVNLSIASANERAKEVGVKKTLGLSKFNIAVQYGLEILCLGIVSFLLAVLLVELILPSFNSFIEKDISILDIALLSKIGGITVLISLLISVFPAVYLSNFKVTKVLKGNVSRGRQGVVARKLMLGLQFLISGFFLIGSLVINKQVRYMIDKDLGFNADEVIVLHFFDRKDKPKKYKLAKKELSKHPNIVDVTSNSYVIGGGNVDSSGFEYNDINVQAYLNAMDYNYLDFMEIEILKGRNLDVSIASDSVKNVLINEAFAKKLNIYDDPVGKMILSGGTSTEDGKLKIVGLVKDHHVTDVDTKIGPIIYLHWNVIGWKKNQVSYMQLKVNPNKISETLSDVERFWNNNIERGYPFEPSFLNNRFGKTYKKHQNQKTLFFIITYIVVLIALLGLFALATLTIQQRLKEVAIRKALGASVKEIMVPLIKEFVIITVIASVFLIPLAYYFSQKWLNNFAYRIDMPLAPYVIAPIVLTLLVFVVVCVKAYNATKVDLIKYLKFE